MVLLVQSASAQLEYGGLSVACQGDDLLFQLDYLPSPSIQDQDFQGNPRNFCSNVDRNEGVDHSLGIQYYIDCVLGCSDLTATLDLY